MSKLAKFIKRRKHFLVLSYNPTLGDSVLICRLLNAIKESHPEAKFSIICHPETLKIYEFFGNFADYHVIGKLLLRIRAKDLPFVSRLLFHIGLSSKIIYLQFRYFSKLILLGPDWFSRASLARSHKSVLSFLFSKRKSNHSTLVTDSYLLHNFKEFATEGIITKSFQNTYMSSRQISVSNSNSQLRSDYVCVVTGAGEVKRDIICINLENIKRILKEIGLDFIVVEGSSRDSTLEEKMTLIVNSSLVLCNDTGWYHVADSFQIPIICLTTRQVEEFDGYVREKQGICVLRPPHNYMDTNCLNQGAYPREIPSNLLGGAIRKLHVSLA
jgi:ADP-heptose:LPS heptosyltransferase